MMHLKAWETSSAGLIGTEIEVGAIDEIIETTGEVEDGIRHPMSEDLPRGTLLVFACQMFLGILRLEAQEGTMEMVGGVRKIVAGMRPHPELLEAEAQMVTKALSDWIQGNGKKSK